MTKLLSRRDALKGAGSLAAAAAVSHCFPIPAVLAAGSPSRKLNVAAIGCGGRGLYLEGACQAGGGPTFSGFASFSGPCLEMMLVGHLAMRAGLNHPVEWDGVNMKSTNRPELSQYVKREYRQGWTL